MLHKRARLEYLKEEARSQVSAIAAASAARNRPCCVILIGGVTCLGERFEWQQLDWLGGGVLGFNSTF